MADFNNTNLADFSGVWVFCEQRQGKLQPTVLELISEARKLADDMGTEVCGLLLGGKGLRGLFDGPFIGEIPVNAQPFALI